MAVKMYVGDVREVLRTMDDNSVDMIWTSFPFFNLRSYLPADHPSKSLEIGAESTPAEYLDVMLELSEEFARVLTEFGTFGVELGDSSSGSGGAGGDYEAGGLREGQNHFDGTASKAARNGGDGDAQRRATRVKASAERGKPDGGSWSNRQVDVELGIRPATVRFRGERDGYPLDKSLCGIPTLYAWSLAYGRNLLRSGLSADELLKAIDSWIEDGMSPAEALLVAREWLPKAMAVTNRTFGRWRIRNLAVWCLDGDTVVYARTPKGEGPVRLLHLTQNWQPGQWDLWDGDRWTPVLGWSSSEADDAIEIEFRNGERISATRNHEWPTQRGLVRTEDLTVGDVVTNVRLPEPDRVEPDLLPADEIGWLIGTFLADGSFDGRDRIQISGHRDESSLRSERLRRLAVAYDGSCTAHDIGTGNEAVVVVRSPILSAVIRRYIAGTSARNKSLRSAAWRRGNSFIAAVLDGYLDGDGHYDAKNDRWRLGFTDNQWLARDLRVACARLGYRCRIKRLPRAADPRGGQFAGTARFYHRGEIRLEMNRNLAPIGGIVALRKSKRRRFFDVGVEGDPHLFALGSGILTHNCRPNPTVGREGDKLRRATSFITMACKSADRWFDLDAVRIDNPRANEFSRTRAQLNRGNPGFHTGEDDSDAAQNPLGAPPLDYFVMSPSQYRGAHYAVMPELLCNVPIESQCPRRVCRSCGTPSRRISYVAPSPFSDLPGIAEKRGGGRAKTPAGLGATGIAHGDESRVAMTIGWSTCECPGTTDLWKDGWRQLETEIESALTEARKRSAPKPERKRILDEVVPPLYQRLAAMYLGRLDGMHEGPGWRPGIVLDPFGGTGTTAVAASALGRDCILIDLDEENVPLVRDRVGLYLEDVEHISLAPVIDKANT